MRKRESVGGKGAFQGVENSTRGPKGKGCGPKSNHGIDDLGPKKRVRERGVCDVGEHTKIRGKKGVTRRGKKRR